MINHKINIVWLKRDLRLHDHLPFDLCEKSNIPFIGIYIYDNDLIKAKDCSMRHLQFIYGSISDMNENLEGRKKIYSFFGDSLAVFKYLNSILNIDNVYAYQETGNLLSFRRDVKIKAYLKENNIKFNEHEKDGIIRGLNNRKGWDKNWYKIINEKIIRNTFNNYINYNLNFKHYKLPKSFTSEVKLISSKFQQPGSSNGHTLLKSFTDKRGFNYSKYISKPNESTFSCSRLSTYLAWGNISAKQAYQYVKKNENFSKHRRSFNAFLIRLKWRSHFIQKFESEYQIEKRCANKAYEKLTYSNDSINLNDWKKGTTGMPLVDAVMRCLDSTGWINFRMRAMLVSVLCHHLDCNWKLGAHHLARLFLDYEPGIHYSQFQMQAGTTGINTVRIYNPIKQSHDHDTDGIFIKKWVPELKNFDIHYIHEPWKNPPIFKNTANNYPNPKIDVLESAKNARTKMWKFKGNLDVRNENTRILRLHTRNFR